MCRPIDTSLPPSGVSTPLQGNTGFIFDLARAGSIQLPPRPRPIVNYMAIYTALHPRILSTRSFTFDNRDSGMHFHTFAWHDIPAGNQARYYCDRQAHRSGEQGAIRRLLKEIPRVCETHARGCVTAYHGHSTIAAEASC